MRKKARDNDQCTDLHLHSIYYRLGSRVSPRMSSAQQPRICSPALISTSPAAGGSSSHRTASPKCLLTAEAPYIACADTHTNSESQCQESRQMDMMMAAERRRAEEELLQPVHAACLALPVVQAPPRPGECAAARRDRFRRRHGERWGCRRAWIASERVRVRSAGCG